MKRLLLCALAGAWVSACGTQAKKCVNINDCAIGQACFQGECRGTGFTGGGTAIGGGGATGQGGGTANTGGGTMSTGCSPTAPDNASRDTDCDGLTDAEEYGTDYGNHSKTDPCVSDSDGDGIPDGVEMGRTSTPNTTCGSRFVADSDPGTKSNPTLADTDGDGLPDGVEDVNHDGRRQDTETNPIKRDTDCDGYGDKQELDGLSGCATDPTKRDTDSDGLPDGVEGGLQPPGADPTGCTYTAATFDADPTTKTSACNADSDGDGVQDGAEDPNKNGRVDPGELDPKNPNDTMGPAQAACATANLKPITFQASGVSDVQMALVPEFAEVQKLSDANGERGFIFYDQATRIAGLAISKPPAGADGNAEEQSVRAKIGGVSAPIIQTYTSWDGFAGATRATYDSSGNIDVKAKINSIAQNLLGTNVMGTLPGAAGAVGPFKVQASFVWRTASRSVVVIALMPAATYSGQALFRMDDTAGGTALAQFGDYATTSCEVFPATINAKVDFLWVVDDSGSMEKSQTAVGNAGTVFANKVNSAGLDWRVGAVTTGYYTDNNAFRPFTTDINVMKEWFTSNTPTWFNINGSGTEEPFSSSQGYVSGVLLPRSTNATANKLRDGANVHLITLTDTRDQSGGTPQSYINFLNNVDSMGGRAVVHGVICPEGMECGDGMTVETPGRIHQAIRSTGGVIGDINIANTNTPQATAQLAATIDAILAAAIGGTGHQLAKPPIAATIKVAMETGQTRNTCNTADVPRDRTNGWDIDAATRRIVFYGNCIPKATGVKIAVSYKSWNDGSPNPNGDPCGATCQAPLVCDPNQRTCVCPADCGGCAAGFSCTKATCTCDPTIN